MWIVKLRVRGEHAMVGNDLKFDTSAEAIAYINDLARRWATVEAWAIEEEAHDPFPNGLRDGPEFLSPWLPTGTQFSEVQVRSIPADPTYTDRELEAVAKQLNTVPLDTPQAIWEIISDLHSAVMGLMREVRKR